MKKNLEFIVVNKWNGVIRSTQRSLDDALKNINGYETDYKIEIYVNPNEAQDD